MNKILFIFILLAILAFDAKSQIEISFAQKITDNFVESELISEISFAQLEYEKFGMISPDMELRVDDDNYFILDNKFTKCVYRFNGDGQLLNTICTYDQQATTTNLPILSNPVLFNINPHLEQLEIYSFENSTVHRFSYNGKKVSQVVLPHTPSDFTRDKDGNYWIYMGWNNKETQFRLIKTDQNGKVLDRKMRLVSKCTQFESFAFSNSERGIYLFELLGNSTFHIIGNTITETFFLNYGTKNLSPAFHTMAPNDSYQMLNYNGYFTVKKYLENKNFVYMFVNYNSISQRELYHVIYDKNTKKIHQFYENAGISAFDKAQALTENDELVFLVAPRKIRQLASSTTDELSPVFEKISEAVNDIKNTMIVRLKLQSIE
jgi:hypothetical protein